MTCSLLNQIINLVNNVHFSSAMELHSSQLVTDPLYNDLSCLIEFLSPRIFTFFFNQVHHFFFFHPSRELALSIILIIFFFTMRFLHLLKHVFNNLFSYTGHSFTLKIGPYQTSNLIFSCFLSL